MADTTQFNRSMQAAIAAAQMGKLGDAREILERAAQESAVNDGFFALYLDVLQAQRDWRALDSAAKAWQKLTPASVRAIDAQARAALESGFLHEAIALFRQSMQIAGTDANRLASYARLCLNAMEYGEAARALEEAELIDPQNVQALSARAGLLTFQGRFADAETLCRRAIALDADDVSSYRLLSQLKRGQLSSIERHALASLAQRPELRAEYRISAALTLGDVIDAEGDTEAAFAAYELGHRLARERDSLEGLKYDSAATAGNTDYLKSLFATIPALTAGVPGPRPIFIVGMPRSGTTLVESLFAAHSRVLACGERMVMRQIRREYLWLAGQAREASAEVRANFQRAYFDRLPDLQGADHITDKNPWNFDAVGLILALFANAHVVHVRRNPVETGLSIYRNEFPKFQAFTQRLEHIGQHYGHYARLMAHWESIAGGRMTTVQYEDFVDKPESAAPALLTACGLDWEEGCRNFQANERLIATLSTVEAREPVGNRSGRAERYAKHLGPLVDALTQANVDLRTGAWKG